MGSRAAVLQVRIHLPPAESQQTFGSWATVEPRPYGLFANANRTGNIALARQLLGVPDPAQSGDEADGAQEGLEHEQWNACPCCGGRMIIIETFAPGCQPRLWPIPSIGLDSS